MKSNRIIFFILPLCFLFCSAALAGQTLSAVKSEKQQLISKIRTISQSIKLKESKKSQLQKKIFASDKSIEKLSVKLRDIQAKQAKAKHKLSNLEKEKTQLLRDIAVSQQSMSQLMRAFYLLQKQNPLKALINQENVNKSARLKTYHDYLIQYYLKQDEIQQAQFTSLAQLDASLSQRLKVLSGLSIKNQQQSKALTKRYKKRTASLDKLSASLKSDVKKVALLKSDRKRLDKLAKEIARFQRLAKLKKEKASGTSFAKLKGGLKWPVNGRVVQKFGRKRAGTKLRWRGVLIETQLASPVKAVANGRVVFSDWLSGYGFVLIIEHGKRYMSLYAHNQQLLLKVGDRVRKNQKIALAGSSGRSGKPALYFEIRHKGKPVNPAKWIISRKSRK